MADSPNSRGRTALFAALVVLIAVLGWVAFTGGGEVERETGLEPPAGSDPEASLDETAEELPPLEDEEVLEEVQEVGPEPGEIVDEVDDEAGEPVEDAVETAEDPLDVDDIADPLDD